MNVSQIKNSSYFFIKPFCVNVMIHFLEAEGVGLLVFSKTTHRTNEALCYKLKMLKSAVGEMNEFRIRSTTSLNLLCS